MIAWALQRLIRLWQAGPSAVMAPSCRYAPSCSAYAAEAVARHGALRGVSAFGATHRALSSLGRFGL